MTHAEHAALASYREMGFWIGPRLFGDHGVERLRDACTRVLSGDLGGRFSPHFLIDDAQPVGGLRRAFNSSFVNPIIRDALYGSRVGELAARLMGVDVVRLWYSQIIEKPGTTTESTAETAAIVGWHQDYRYWQCCEHTNFVTAWIALQETTRTNGGMRFVIGSNKWGLVPSDKGFNAQQLDELRRTLQAKTTQNWVEKDCDLQPGQVSFHHSLTFHASGSNRSSDSRLGIAVHLMPSGTRRRHGSACHQSLTFLEPMPRPLDPFVGDQWPIIWPVE
jgi:hypothetical protein